MESRLWGRGNVTFGIVGRQARRIILFSEFKGLRRGGQENRGKLDEGGKETEEGGYSATAQ